jgi:hypothetical protein
MTVDIDRNFIYLKWLCSLIVNFNVAQYRKRGKKFKNILVHLFYFSLAPYNNVMMKQFKIYVIIEKISYINTLRKRREILFKHINKQRIKIIYKTRDQSCKSNTYR